MSQMITRKCYQNRQAGYTDDYEIEYRREDSGIITIWFLQKPSHQYSNSEHNTHINPETKKMCVARGREPRSFEVAEAIAHYQMLRFSEYCRTGRYEDTGATIKT